MRPSPVLQATLAALLAACVLLLGLAAWSPALHERFCADHATATSHASHDHDAPVGDDADPDHRCAITLFDGGCVLPLEDPISPASALNAVRVAAFTELLLARTLRGPARVCGPPLLG